MESFEPKILVRIRILHILEHFTDCNHSLTYYIYDMLRMDV